MLLSSANFTAQRIVFGNTHEACFNAGGQRLRHLTTLRMIERIAKTGSIRRAAEDLAITPSAVQRRLQTFEAELGEQIFERLANGVRLNAAGELVLLHIRTQIAETERLKSRVADLAGVRRGHVSIVCSQAMAPVFLPAEIALYRTQFPNVSFSVQVASHEGALRALDDLEADIAIIFDPDDPPKFQTIMAVHQPLCALFSSNHPLAAIKTLRLRDCLAYPLALPASPFGGRQLLDRAFGQKSISVKPAVESNSFEFLRAHVIEEQSVTFQIPIGIPASGASGKIAMRPLDKRDIPGGYLFVGQRPERALPVASARFADQIASRLAKKYEAIV